MKLDELLEKYPAAKIYFEHMPSELLERYTIRTFPPGYIIHQKDYPLNYFGIIVHGDHRVINEFMIQGGDPQGLGIGGPGYSIYGEFKSNGFDNPVKHERGVISMARTNVPNSAGSQFFIMHKDSSHLDGSYAAFGKVIEGIDVVDQIASVECNHLDQPVIGQVMKSVTVDTKGVDYEEPNKL